MSGSSCRPWPGAALRAHRPRPELDQFVRGADGLRGRALVVDHRRAPAGAAQVRCRACSTRRSRPWARVASRGPPRVSRGPPPAIPDGRHGVPADGAGQRRAVDRRAAARLRRHRERDRHAGRRAAARAIGCARHGGRQHGEVDDTVCAFDEGQLPLAGPYGDVVGIAHAHMQAVVDRALSADRRSTSCTTTSRSSAPRPFAALPAPAPPGAADAALGPRQAPRFYGSFDGRGRVAFAAVSDSQLAAAPANLRRQTLGVVPLAAPVDPGRRRPAGDHLLARAAHPPQGVRRGGTAVPAPRAPLVMAGPLGGFPTGLRSTGASPTPTAGCAPT